jgi:hypothetical protein
MKEIFKCHCSVQRLWPSTFIHRCVGNSIDSDDPLLQKRFPKFLNSDSMLASVVSQEEKPSLDKLLCAALVRVRELPPFSSAINQPMSWRFFGMAGHICILPQAER